MEDKNTDMFELSDIKMSAEVDKLFVALSKMQGGVKNALKDTKNDFYRSSYADLESVWGAVREPMSANGLAMVQIPITEGDKAGVVSILGHESGQFISGKLLLSPGSKGKDGAFTPAKDPQSLGSCFTYARRYSLAAFMAIAQADDDGNAASGIEGSQTSKKDVKPPAQTPVQKPVSKPAATDRRQELREKITKHLTEEQLKDFVVAYFGVSDARGLPRDPELYIAPYEVLVEVLPFEPDNSGVTMSMAEAAALTKENIDARFKLTNPR